MNSTKKGDELEYWLHDYLRVQIESANLVLGVYPAELCKLHQKKKYFCKEREADVEFDIVVEVYRVGTSTPHISLVFECKNHESPIQERDITDFSDKLGRIFAHGAKGFIVSSSRLQRGAERIASSRRIGIVKFDKNGIEIVAERKSGLWSEGSFLEAQVFDNLSAPKSLKFVAYSEGRFFGSASDLILTLEQASTGGLVDTPAEREHTVPFLKDEAIREIAAESHSLLMHSRGAVDVHELCSLLGLKLQFTDQVDQDSVGREILGTANFERRKIEINRHGHRQRERFTIAHEIGHFCLDHGRYILSDFVVESDLFLGGDFERSLNFERLEQQANIYASELLLPREDFLNSTRELRDRLDIKDRGFGYIFVDNQPCNYVPYNELISSLSLHYDVSRQAIEVRLKRMRLVTDKRQDGQPRRLGSVDRIVGH